MDFVVLTICYTPMIIIAYTCCYFMLDHRNPGHSSEYATHSFYGCIQCIIGYTSGYFSARWLYNKNNANNQNPRTEPVEEIPLLPINPIAADTEEALPA
jgi:hypothetical protein